MYGTKLKKLVLLIGRKDMSKEKKNWLVIYRERTWGNGFAQVSQPMTKKEAKVVFKECKNVRYAVHIKKERK